MITSALLHVLDIVIGVQQVRTELKDKGYYRWPPHINLMYPFLPPQNFDAIVPSMTNALQSVCPFEVSLERFGTFGGAKTGVCWLDPTPHHPIKNIQCLLESAIDEFEGSSKKGGKPFVPHMTVSHLESITEANLTAAMAQQTWEPVSFTVKEVYILERVGNEPFKIVWRIPLGGVSGYSREDGGASVVSSTSTSGTISAADAVVPVKEGGKVFVGMPETEADWVKDLRTASNTSRSRHRSRGKSKH